jgi:hypothetical protein
MSCSTHNVNKHSITGSGVLKCLPPVLCSAEFKMSSETEDPASSKLVNITPTTTEQVPGTLNLNGTGSADEVGLPACSTHGIPVACGNTVLRCRTLVRLITLQGSLEAG